MLANVLHDKILEQPNLARLKLTNTVTLIQAIKNLINTGADQSIMIATVLSILIDKSFRIELIMLEPLVIQFNCLEEYRLALISNASNHRFDIDQSLSAETKHALAQIDCLKAYSIGNLKQSQLAMANRLGLKSDQEKQVEDNIKALDQKRFELFTNGTVTYNDITINIRDSQVFLYLSAIALSENDNEYKFIHLKNGSQFTTLVTRTKARELLLGFNAEMNKFQAAYENEKLNIQQLKPSSNFNFNV